MIANPLQVKRTTTILRPDQTRVLLRPFTSGRFPAGRQDYRQDHVAAGKASRPTPG